MTVNYSNLDQFQRQICLALLAAVALLGLYGQLQLWQLDIDGLSQLSGRLPYWDFSNLWAGSTMALQGNVDRLFQVGAYRHELDQLFGVTLPEQEWSYPPHILLVGVPLALMPIWLAYAAWTVGTLAALHFALRPFRLPFIAHVAVLLCPAIWSNQIFGQNGAATAALLIAGLYHARSRPVLAGFLIGLLTIKPHLGILVPIALLASLNHRAILSAAVTTLGLLLLTGLIFGFHVWSLFLTETRPLMTSIMEAPYPQHFHSHAATVFVLLRSVGAELGPAYAAQGAVALAAAVVTAWLWRPANAIDHPTRVVLTGLLVILATPYGYTYDTTPLYLALVWLMLRDPKPNLAVYGVVWLSSLVAPSFHLVGVAAGIVAPLGFAIYALARLGAGDLKPLVKIRAS